MSVTPYQVDYQHVVAGKHFSSTKRRVSFVFGIASEVALSRGLRGPKCRDEEHEVVLVWSCASGKQLVTLNGEQIYRNTQRTLFGGNQKLEHTFYIGRHIVVLTGEVSLLPFLDPAQQFDLKLNGQSYFCMKKIFELGQDRDHSMMARRQYNNIHNVNVNVNHNNHNNSMSDEENLIQMAKRISLQEVEIQLVDKRKQLLRRSSHSQPNLMANLDTRSPRNVRAPTNNNAIPSFQPQPEPTIMTFMKPPNSPANISNGPPNEVNVVTDQPSYQTPLHKRQEHKTTTSSSEVEPWEELADFASLKDGEESVLFQSHDYYNYYQDYVQRGGEKISHPTATATATSMAPQPSAPPPVPIPVTISYFDPYGNGNLHETPLGHMPRVRSYTAPDSTPETSSFHPTPKHDSNPNDNPQTIHSRHPTSTPYSYSQNQSYRGVSILMLLQTFNLPIGQEFQQIIIPVLPII